MLPTRVSKRWESVRANATPEPSASVASVIKRPTRAVEESKRVAALMSAA